MLKHCRQLSKGSKPSNDGQDPTYNKNPTSFDNEGFSDNDVSICDAKDFDIHQIRASSIALRNNSTLRRGLSANSNNTLHKSHDECEVGETSTEQSSHNKTIAFTIILMIMVLGVCSALGHHYIGYYPETKILNYGDAKIIDYLPYFCSTITSESDDVWLSVVSKVDYIGHVRYTMSALLYLEVGQTWSRMFHLSKKSTVSITLLSKDIIFVIVFKGKNNYDLWIERKTTISYEMKQACCVNGKSTTSDLIEFTSNENEDYYFVLYRDELFGSPVNFNVTFEFIRPRIDSTRIKQQCKTSIYSKCSVSLKFGSSETAIIELYNRNHNGVIAKETNITWKCDARIWFYVIVYGISIIILSAVIILFYINVKKYFRSSKQSKAINKDIAFSNQARDSISTNERNSVNLSSINVAYSPPHRSCGSKTSNESIEKYQNCTVDYDVCDKEFLELKSDQSGNNATSRNNKEIQSKLKADDLTKILRTDSNCSIHKSPAAKYTRRKSKTHEKRSTVLELKSLRKDDSNEMTVDLSMKRKTVEETIVGDMLDENSKKIHQNTMKGANGSKTTKQEDRQTIAFTSQSNALIGNENLNSHPRQSPTDRFEALSVESVGQNREYQDVHKPSSQKSKDSEIVMIGKPIDI